MYEAEQKRLLYVAATRARDHLVLSLFRGKEDCHAVRIRRHLAERPELAAEIALDMVDAIETPDVALERNVRNGTADIEARAQQHRADELAFVVDRNQRIAALSQQVVIAPSALGHMDPDEPRDAPPEPDANDTVRRLRRGKGGSAVGRAVHAVLQIIDLATLDQLDALSAAAARDEGIADQVAVIRRYVQSAAESEPVQRATSSGRYWREVPIAVAHDNGTIVEGTIDLLHEQADGRLVIVDYKTDRVSEAEFAARAESYRPQGNAYAASVARATGREVARVALVFAALGGRFSELDWRVPSGDDV
jgi:ATP-dependent exoDNAse (exonuclease V) beta subunit